MTGIQEKDYDANAVFSFLSQLKEEYSFIIIKRIGKTVQGRDINAVEIGAGENTVLFAGAFHGTERITTNLLLHFIYKFIQAVKNGGDFCGVNARNMLFGKTLAVIPSINPDGCEIAMKGIPAAGFYSDRVREISKGITTDWNANVRGVDINHNFDAGWDISQKIEKEMGIYTPCKSKYGGSAPESEPETKAIADYCRSNKIVNAIAFHSQGREIYHEYGEYTPQKSHRLVRLFSTSSGYKIAQPQKSASHAGFKDWFIKEYKHPAFTFEIGEGRNPLPPESIFDIYKEIEESLMLGIALA